ncbi:hypothetical protein ACJX0J_006570, partial [Zea mays]
GYFFLFAKITFRKNKNKTPTLLDKEKEDRNIKPTSFPFLKKGYSAQFIGVMGRAICFLKLRERETVFKTVLLAQHNC